MGGSNTNSRIRTYFQQCLGRRHFEDVAAVSRNMSLLCKSVNGPIKSSLATVVTLRERPEGRGNEVRARASELIETASTQ